MQKIDIAVANTRKASKWKNVQTTWADLTKRFSETHRTAETLAEYMAAPKGIQDNWKDVGGFVGGYLSNGKRSVNSVMHRQLITLDVDFGKSDMWFDFTMLYGCAAAMYSTHKHTPDAPRLRIVIPLSREVLADEYEAIARRIAGDLDIELFDPTTFQACRLMYWPSTSKDGVFRFEEQHGEWLDADAVLSRYRDWKDASAWPTSVRQGEEILRGIKKQGDPTEKAGIVGAFCRVYDIHEAIAEHLEGVYTESDIEGRYTFVGGSTGGGLVTYDDKFAYSHHGTDPASGKLCNAFDLVRLHKYGEQDAGAGADVPANKRPSYLAMCEFATGLGAVRKMIGQERLAAAAAEFEEVDGEEISTEAGDWLTEMDVDSKGVFKQTIANVVLLLENDPNLKGALGYDEFRRSECICKGLPWKKKLGEFTDSDEANLRNYIETVYRINATSKIADALQIVFRKNSFHPVRDFLSGLTWDGRKRLDSLFIDYLGAEDTPFIRAATRKTLCAAVARVYVAGCKFDNVLVLVGTQGVGKSSIIGKLGGDWYSDSFAGVQGKDAYEALQGAWLIEIGELAGLKKAEVEATKHFMSKRVDSYRAAFAKRKESHPRQCIFFATTNQFDFLRDITGNRRFWPVVVGVQPCKKSIWADLTEYERKQIWAEAVACYNKGEELHLDDEMTEEARVVQNAHVETDERTGLVAAYLEKLLPANWADLDLYQRRAFLAGESDPTQPAGTIQRDRVCVAEVWQEVLGGTSKDMNRGASNDVIRMLSQISGWVKVEKIMRVDKYGPQKCFVRIVHPLRTTQKFNLN